MRTILLTILLGISAYAAPNSAIGYSADPAIPGDSLTDRIDAMNPLYVRAWIGWDVIEKVRGTQVWDTADRVIIFNALRGRKTMCCIFPYPDWLAALPEVEWIKARSVFVKTVVARYAYALWALESCNEPYVMKPSQAWGYIPGITDDTVTLRSKLLEIYRADAAAIRGTGIKLAGPSFSSARWSPDAKALLDAGALLDVITLHSYGGIAQLNDTLAGWKLIAAGRPVHCNEFALFTEDNKDVSPDSVAEVRDARTAALAFLSNGVVPYPHALLQRSGKSGEWRGAGYQISNDPAPFVPKEWAREFLWLMRLPLTPEQLQVRP